MIENIIQVNNEYGAWLLGALLLCLVALLIWLARRRRSRGGLGELLAAVGVDRISDILVADGMGGQIHIEHLILTGQGLLVLDVKRIKGTVFASDRMDEWTVMTPKDRISIQNPQPALYDRIAALRLLVRDVPVSGHILFVEGADFSKGRPKHVILPDELLARYKKPEKADLERIMDAFFPHWELVREACKPASASGS